MCFLPRAWIVLLSSLYVSIDLLGGNGAATRGHLLGGWTVQNASGNPKYLQLAHAVISNQTKAHDYYDTVLNLTAVETQVVAGVNYKLNFTTAKSICKTEKVYRMECCLPEVKEAERNCTAVIYEIPWLNQTSTTTFRNSGSADCGRAEK
uniref:Putative salivary cystatin n=1 Tax=Ixodes ricinus TaxID=34613 RepID=A0A0K8R3D7_IXORI